jgi:hypothetical protein
MYLYSFISFSVCQAGTGQRWAGTGQRQAGTGQRQAGTGPRIFSTGQRIFNTGQRIFSTGLRILGAGLRIFGNGHFMQVRGIGPNLLVARGILTFDPFFWINFGHHPRKYGDFFPQVRGIAGRKYGELRAASTGNCVSQVRGIAAEGPLARGCGQGWGAWLHAGRACGCMGQGCLAQG